jgi:SP family sugar:H+ symporter-like MFS transporter
MTTIRGSLLAEAQQTAESSWTDLIKDPVEQRKVIYSAGTLLAQQINGIRVIFIISAL